MSRSAPVLVHSYVTAADGCKLSYYTVGTGPSVLILHGAMSFALSHKELAILLSPYYTVHIVSRRGRGLSGPYPKTVTESDFLAKGTPGRTYTPEYANAVLGTDIADLNTFIEATRATYLITCSSGALLALQALLQPPASVPSIATLAKTIIFEPPAIFSDKNIQSIDISQLKQFEVELARGDFAGALVTAMGVVQLGPSWIPRWIMKLMTNWMLSNQVKAAAKIAADGGENLGNHTFQGLGGMLRYDFAIVEAGIRDSKDYKALPASKILLFEGGKSPAYLREAIATLQKVTGGQSMCIAKVGHELLMSPEMRGQPQKAIADIRKFLS